MAAFLSPVEVGYFIVIVDLLANVMTARRPRQAIAALLLHFSNSPVQRRRFAFGAAVYGH